MDAVADWYQWIFNFHQIRYFDIEGRFTGLHSRAMTSPCGKDSHSDQRKRRREQPDRGISPRLQRRRDSAHRLRCRDIFETVAKLRGRRTGVHADAAGLLLRQDRRTHPRAWRVRRALQELGILIDGDRWVRERTTKAAAANFFQNRDRPDLLRIHRAQGRRRFWRRQFSRSVRIDRRGSDSGAAC